MSNHHDKIRIGTCSWKYPEWHGLVYSAPKGIDYLKEYSRKYSTVEIDQWFWSLFSPDTGAKMPKPADVFRYRDAVPDTFRFSIKVPNSITLTHYYKKDKAGNPVANPFFLSSDLFRKFLSMIDPLKGFLGPIIFQFEYLNKMKMPSPKMFRDRFGEFLDRIPSNYVYGLEVRNKNYFNKGYFDFLSESGLAPVLIEGYWIPPIAELFQKWGDEIRKHLLVILRLMGKDRKGIQAITGNTWDRIVEPKDDELRLIADIVKDLAGSGVEVYLNVNNHYEGCAPATIERIESILGEK
jgi:uncharacterized protein YecE (DUF72 family)